MSKLRRCGQRGPRYNVFLLGAFLLSAQPFAQTDKIWNCRGITYLAQCLRRRRSQMGIRIRVSYSAYEPVHRCSTDCPERLDREHESQQLLVRRVPISLGKWLQYA